MLETVVARAFGLSDHNARLFLSQCLGIEWTPAPHPSARFRGDNTLAKLYELKDFLESDECPSHMSWYTKIPISFFKYESRLLPTLDQLEMTDAAPAYAFSFSASAQLRNDYPIDATQSGFVTLSTEDAVGFVVSMAAVYIYSALHEGLLGNIVPMQDLVKDAQQKSAAPETTVYPFAQASPSFPDVPMAPAPFSPAVEDFFEAPFSPALDAPPAEAAPFAATTSVPLTQKPAPASPVSNDGDDSLSLKSEWTRRIERESAQASQVFADLFSNVKPFEGLLYIDGGTQKNIANFFKQAMEHDKKQYLYVNTRTKSDNVSPNHEFFLSYFSDESFRKNKQGPQIKERLALLFSRPLLIINQSTHTGMIDLLLGTLANNKNVVGLFHTAPAGLAGWHTDPAPISFAKYNFSGYLSHPLTRHAPVAQSEPDNELFAAFRKVKTLESFEALKAAYSPFHRKRKVTDPFGIVLRAAFKKISREKDPARADHALRTLTFESLLPQLSVEEP